MNDEIRAMLNGKTEYRDANVRGVDGGYVIAGQRRWTDPATGQGVYQVGSETVAATPEDCAQKVSTFILTGSFVATQH